MKIVMAVALIFFVTGCASTPPKETEAEALSSFISNEQTKKIDALEERETKLEELVQLLVNARKIDHARMILSGGEDEER